jgi:hypothetical protein
MKNFFELIGFLATACISGFLVFLFIGSSKKGNGLETLTTHLNRAEPTIEEPANVWKPSDRRNAAENNGKGAGPRKKNQPETPAIENETAATDVKELYNDGAFVGGAVRKWKNTVKEASEEYSLKPQVLMAHVIIQSYLGGYNKNRFNADLEEHAGEKVMSTAAAVKRYEYGWSMKKLIEQYDLTQYFPEEIPTANAGYHAPAARVTEKASAKRDFKSEAGASAASFSASAGKVSQMEDGFRRLVAKEFGAASWQELQSDPNKKTKAQQRVKMLMTSARIK